MLRKLVVLALSLCAFPLAAAIPVSGSDGPPQGVVVVEETEGPSLVAPVVTNVAIVISGTHKEGVRNITVPPGAACAVAPGPNTVTVTCFPPATLKQCLSWQASVTGTGVGFVTGSATCNNAPPSVAFTQKPGQGVGPVVNGPAPFPLVCTAKWQGEFGDWRVVCRYTIV